MASKFATTLTRLPLAGPLLAGILLAGLSLPGLLFAQGRVLTAQDYARAERFVGYNANPLVDHAVTSVTWLDDGHFWYRDHDAGGDRFLVMDAATGEVRSAFDRDRLAAALSKVAGKPVKADKLPVTAYSIAADGGHEITVRGKRYLCDPAIDGCTEVAAKGGKEPGVRSPDGRSEAFIRDWNLWLRDLATGKETQLTTDGSTDYGYATDNAGWTHSDRAILVWSPDSSKIATFRQDQRKTGTMTLVKTTVGHPEVETWKYPLVGEKDITMIERVVIDVPTKSVVRLQMPPDQHRSTQCDDVSCFGGWEDVQWSGGIFSRTSAFVGTSMTTRSIMVMSLSPTSGYFQVLAFGCPSSVETRVMVPVLRWSCWKVAIFFESGDHTRIARSLWVQPALSVA